MYFYICQGTMYYQTVQYAVIGSIHNVKQQYIGTFQPVTKLHQNPVKPRTLFEVDPIRSSRVKILLIFIR